MKLSCAPQVSSVAALTLVHVSEPVKEEQGGGEEEEEGCIIQESRQNRTCFDFFLELHVTVSFCLQVSKSVDLGR